MFEWTENDQIEAEAFRLNRLRRFCTELIGACFLHLGQDNILNVHAQTPGDIDRLLDPNNLEELAGFTWICTGAIEIALWFCQEEILSIPTQPLELLLEEKLLYSLQSTEDPLTNEDFSEMATTTLLRSKSAPIANVTTTRPQLKRLRTVAYYMQISVEEAEAICDRNGIQIQLDESGDPVVRLDDAAEILKAAALIKLSAPPQNGARNGGTITADAIAQIAEPEVAPAEAVQEPAQPKMAALPEGFKVSGNFKRTVANALVAFVPNAKNQKRRRQIAAAIGNQTADGMKYLKGLLAMYPDEQKDWAKNHLIAQFKKQADILSRNLLKEAAQTAD